MSEMAIYRQSSKEVTSAVYDEPDAAAMVWNSGRVMPTRDHLTDTGIRYRQRITWLIICLVVPTWLLLAFEWVGGSRFGKDPIQLGVWEPLIGIALALVFATPAFVAVGFVVAFWKRNTLRMRRGLLSALLLLLTFSFLASMFSFIATFGGHPVWVQGYR
jgi:hypothetical protein